MSHLDQRLENKRVFITGASGGLGEQVAYQAARRGAIVIVAARREDRLTEVRERCMKLSGRDAFAYGLDVGDRMQVSKVLNRIIGEAGGKIDVLVNSAAVYSRRPLSETDAQRLADAYAVNFIAPFLLMRSFATVCRKGAIINLLDQRVAQADFRAGAYGLAKKSLRDATEAAALEWAPRIRVNGVAPGLVAPPPGVPWEKMSPLLARVPTQRAVTMEEVARACLFLAQMNAITGQTLYLDGGLHLLGPNAAGEK